MTFRPPPLSPFLLHCSKFLISPAAAEFNTYIIDTRGDCCNFRENIGLLDVTLAIIARVLFDQKSQLLRIFLLLPCLCSGEWGGGVEGGKGFFNFPKINSAVEPGIDCLTPRIRMKTAIFSRGENGFSFSVKKS